MLNFRGELQPVKFVLVGMGDVAYLEAENVYVVCCPNFESTLEEWLSGVCSGRVVVLPTSAASPIPDPSEQLKG
ncbi:unnamed protein product [Prunus armeniaca]